MPDSKTFVENVLGLYYHGDDNPDQCTAPRVVPLSAAAGGAAPGIYAAVMMPIATAALAVFAALN